MLDRVVPTSVGARGGADPQAPVAAPAARADTQSDAGGVIVRHAQPPQWPSMLPWIMGVALLLLAYRFLGDDYVIHDAPAFREALRIWSPVLARIESTRSPRELKRFKNKARYFAVRLQPVKPSAGACEQVVAARLARGQSALKPPTISIPESHLVTLTAVHHLRPSLVRQLFNGSDAVWTLAAKMLASESEGAAASVEDRGFAPAVMRAFQSLRKRAQDDSVFGAWPIPLEHVDRFLEAAGEFVTGGQVAVEALAEMDFPASDDSSEPAAARESPGE